MRQTLLQCDGCQADLLVSTNTINDFLQLTREQRPKPTFGRGYAGGMFQKLIDRDYHFCDLDCLETWMRGIGALERTLARSFEENE